MNVAELKVEIKKEVRAEVQKDISALTVSLNNLIKNVESLTTMHKVGKGMDKDGKHSSHFTS